MNQELKNALPALSVAAAIAIGGFFLSQRNSAPMADHAPTNVKQEDQRTIMLHTSNWKFAPNVIRVKQDENVALHLMGIEGNHGIAIPDLGINERMDQGSTKLVTIPTDKPGTYPFFCNVSCGPGHADMEGTLIIE